ncbi:MAG: cation transporter [Candidatus Dadabacteria bacterium]
MIDLNSLSIIGRINQNKKLRTAALSVVVSFSLIVVKLLFGFLTNSISIFASAVDSFLDLAASSVNYFSIKKAEKPADREHRFGHGKAEGLAGVFQSLIFGGSSIYLIYVSVKRLVIKTPLQSLDLGIFIMIFSAFVSFFLARYLKRVSKDTESVALGADSVHYSSDVYTNLGVIFGLVIVKFTGLVLIDSLVSICVALYIIWSIATIFREAVDILMDRELPKEIVREVERIILKHKPLVKGFHKMRTRRSGSEKFIEFHLVVDHTLSFVESHRVAEEIIKDIENAIPNSDVMVHVDPHTLPDYS